MNDHTIQLGELKCRVIDALPAETQPRLIVVLCHGYGASGSDLVPFGAELFKYTPSLAAHVQFVFPEAPLDLSDLGMPEGRAWWHLDLQKLQMAVAFGQLRDLREDKPEGLELSRQRLSSMISEWSRQTAVPIDRFVLGGFSQGAMLATDVTLNCDGNPAGLIVLSGTLLNESEWRQRVSHRRGLTVLQSHGTEDPILPHSTAEALRDMLTDAGSRVEFISFRGGHTIPIDVFRRIASTLERLCIGPQSVDP